MWWGCSWRLWKVLFSSVWWYSMFWNLCLSPSCEVHQHHSIPCLKSPPSRAGNLSSPSAFNFNHVFCFIKGVKCEICGLGGINLNSGEQKWKKCNQTRQRKVEGNKVDVSFAISWTGLINVVHIFLWAFFIWAWSGLRNCEKCVVEDKRRRYCCLNILPFMFFLIWGLYHSTQCRWAMMKVFNKMRPIC